MKILVIRFSSIGDIVLTSPVVRCLHQQLGAEVHFFTKKAFASLVSPNPHVAKVYTFDKDVQEVIPDLRAENYDQIIDLHHNLRSFIVKMALRKPTTAYHKFNIEKWLLVNTPFDIMPKNHVVDRNMATVKHLGVTYDGQGMDHFIPAGDEVDVASLSPALSPGNYVAFVVGATHFTKRLPFEKILDVCRKINRPVVILGGKAEMETGKKLAEQGGAHVVDACGQLSLNQSASVVRQAAKVVTHDTGLMHIAAALHKDIISVWGGTEKRLGFTPFYPDGMDANISIEVLGLKCRPCSKMGKKACPKGHFKCMQDIDTQMIATAANQG